MSRLLPWEVHCGCPACHVKPRQKCVTFKPNHYRPGRETTAHKARYELWCYLFCRKLCEVSMEVQCTVLGTARLQCGHWIVVLSEHATDKDIPDSGPWCKWKGSVSLGTNIMCMVCLSRQRAFEWLPGRAVQLTDEGKPKGA